MRGLMKAECLSIRGVQEAQGLVECEATFKVTEYSKKTRNAFYFFVGIIIKVKRGKGFL